VRSPESLLAYLHNLGVVCYQPDLFDARIILDLSWALQLAGRRNDHEASWCLEYEYPSLHPGLMRALLRDVGSRFKEAGVYWKYGVWVYEKSTGGRALLAQRITDERRGRISLKVQGRRGEDLARWLRERIEARNRLFGSPELKPSVDDFTLGLRPQERGGPDSIA
jgi:hypothetical protein